MTKYAVIVVDMLNDFVTGVLKAKRAPRIIPNIQRLLAFARENEIPVIYTNDAHLPGVDKEFQLWGEHAVKGTHGAEVIDELKPKRGDYVIEKRRYSGFFETDLDLLLRELGVDALIFTGIATNICVQHTMADAYFRGYKIILPEDCVESFSDEEQKYGLDYAKRIYGAELTSVKNIIEKLRKRKS